MRNFLRTIFVTAVFSVLGACVSNNAPDGIPDAAVDEAAEGTLQQKPIIIGQSFSLPSIIMGEAREINVWVPPSYEEGEKSYPVLYVIDGAADQDFHHISALGQLTTLNGDYDEMIVVGIGTRDRLRELTSKPKDPRYIRNPPDSGDGATFRKHVSDEVIPFIEVRYRTNDRRAVIGESLAGLWIAEVFFRAPDLFTDYISISPSLWWDDKALAKDADAILAQFPAGERRLYFTMANEGGTMQGGLDLIIAAIKKHQPKGLKWHYVDRRKSEVHSTIYHGAALDALRILFGRPAPDYGETPWYLTEDGQPPTDP
ncbi:MAG: alpha/beta hydrolase [Alphaproteobacteria bacterium]|nr:alpha/beta hydrolase [Alphaproteobacteria bacterium]